MQWEEETDMSATFLKYDKPLLTAMIQCSTAEECIAKIKASIADGADALGIQLCRLKKEFRTKESLKHIFDACEGRPIYVTSYRHSESEGYTDEACGELLLLALDAGATLCDVIGDMFGVCPPYQLAEDEEAVKKQKSLIDEIHRRGGEVLISSHVSKSMTVEECLRIAKAQEERGADVIKIVACDSQDESDVARYIEAIQTILNSTDKKLLFLASGKSRLIRYIGPSLGVCMYLCVESHGAVDTPEQPVLKKLKLVRDNILITDPPRI